MNILNYEIFLLFYNLNTCIVNWSSADDACWWNLDTSERNYILILWWMKRNMLGPFSA